MPRTTTRPSTVEKLVCVKKGENFTFRANNWSCKMPKVCEHELGLMPYEKTLAKSCQECCWVPKTTPPGKLAENTAVSQVHSFLFFQLGFWR